jgi:hypothetical protein
MGSRVDVWTTRLSMPRRHGQVLPELVIPEGGHADVVLLLQAVGVALAQQLLEPGAVPLALRDHPLGRPDDPPRLFHERLGIDWAGHDVQQPPIRRAEIGGHVAALLLAVPADAEGADALGGGNEPLVDELPHLIVGQGVRTEGPRRCFR